MSYLARLKALDELGQDPILPPFEAFGGWSSTPFSTSAVPQTKPFGAFDSDPPGYFPTHRPLKQGVRRGVFRQKGPLREPSKASKGPADWQAGLNRLVEAPAPRGVSTWQWFDAVKRAVSFCDNWSAAAVACGWSEEALFGLHPGAPLLRFDAMGVAFLGTDAVVVGVEPGAVLFRCQGGNINRGRPPTNPQKPAWLGPWMPSLRPRAKKQ